MRITKKQSTGGKSVKIAYASDIHIEFRRGNIDFMEPLLKSADVLVLAGDIDTQKNTVESIQQMADSHPNIEIIYVAGNHEFYHEDHGELLKYYREAFSKIGNAHFLENDAITIKGIKFLGCTLWTGFNAYPDYTARQSMKEAARYIGDFHYIYTEGSNNKACYLTPDKMRSLFLQSRNWLESELCNSDPAKTVVVTHFPPSIQCLHGRIPINSMTNYFVAACDRLISKYQPTVWVYGHNHWGDHIVIGKTHLVSNQLGYPNEVSRLPRFHSEVLEVPNEEA